MMCKYWDDNLMKMYELFCSPLKTEKTKKQYFRVIDETMDFCKKAFIDIDEEDANNVYEMFCKKYTERTSYTYITILKRFSSYLIENGIHPAYTENPFMAHFIFFRNKITTLDYTVLTIAEMDRILAVARKDEKAYAIISFIYRTGIRPDLICNIRIRDFYNDSEHMYLRVYKKKQEQILLIPEDLTAILDAYIAAYSINLDDKDRYLFLNKKNKQMDERTLQRLLNKISSEAGFNVNVTPYDIRNASAALFFAYGANNAQVADQLQISMRHVNRYNTTTINPDIVSNANGLVTMHLELPNPQ